jgi:hypothetical protein
MFLGLAAAACGGEQLVVAEEAARDPAAMGSVGGGSEPAVVSVVAACPSSPEERKVVLGCWPTRHVGRWRGFFLGNPTYLTMAGEVSQFPIGDLVLSVGTLGAAYLSFGEPVPFDPPEGPLDPYLCIGSSPAVGCAAAQRIIVGFEYALEEIEILDPMLETSGRIIGELPLRVGERLSFGVPLEQPWRSWCELQEPEREACQCTEQCEPRLQECFRFGPPRASIDGYGCTIRDGATTSSVDCGWLAAQIDAPCRCAEAGCFARRSSLSISLRMSDDGRALQGTVQVDGVERGRVEFLREADW